ncbi:anti-sigma factor [Microbacterium sp. SS28]|uniref:anti-sigma factor n=1 Tax=Microbacterium sp. SS28 TaxID=2919948 RepID=UPI001FA94969|nr:anti-sigma factor [Microbacterium sp. SS28]
MSHAAVVARATMDETQLEAPPARVWARLADELGLAPDLDPVGISTQRRDETGTDAASPAPSTSPAAAGPGSPAAPAAAARARGRSGRWSRRGVWALAASVAFLLVIGGGVWAGIGLLGPTSIATAALDAFPSHPDAVGEAVVEEARDGARTLTVSLDGDAASDEYREVWLIRSDGARLISLGVLEGSSGSFPIPAGVDLSQYDLVDISFEPVDGDPAHSGDSIVRGQLSFV